jgi:hypothetical protein
MLENIHKMISQRAMAVVSIVALLLVLAPIAVAQDTAAVQPAGETVAPKAVVEPLLREYRGVQIGMSAADVRAKLGNLEEKSDEMDFFVFSDKERARVYYQDGKANAIIATYMGKDNDAPTPRAVLGTTSKPSRTAHSTG